jgi:hypothetical protein
MPISAAEQDPVTAIDILLEPDETMIEKAMAANQRLLKAFPEGFARDETHIPHKVPGSTRLPSTVISTGSSIGSASSSKGFTPGAKGSSVITPSTVSKPRPKLSSLCRDRVAPLGADEKYPNGFRALQNATWRVREGRPAGANYLMLGSFFRRVAVTCIRSAT